MMIKTKQLFIPTAIQDGEVLIALDGKVSFSGSTATGIRLPAGLTSERPVDAEAGLVRFNTEAALLEFFSGTEWIQSGKSSKISSDDGETYIDTQEIDGKLVIAIDAVNKLVFENIDGDTVQISVTGTATDIDLVLAPKGAGQLLAPVGYVPVSAASLVTKSYADSGKIPASGLVGQVLKQLDATTYGWADAILNSKGLTLFVDQRNGVDTNIGTYDRPFKTITAALDSVTVANTRIVCSAGTYLENLVIDIPVSIEGAGVYSAPLVTIIGNHTVTVDATSFGLSNVTLAPVQDNAASIVSFVSSVGSVIFDNVRFQEDVNSFPAITFTGDNSGWFMFKDCDLAGKVSIETESTTPYTVYLVEGFGVTDIVLSDPVASVFVSNRSLLGSVEHFAGVLLINNVNQIQSLNSQADIGFLEINKSSFYDSENGDYGISTKSGTVDYIFSYSVRDPGVIWNGTQILLADTDHIKTEKIATNYRTISKSVTSHLSGIDEALGNAGVAVEFVAATRTVSAERNHTVYIVTATGVDIVLPATSDVLDGTKVTIKDGFGVSSTPINITAGTGDFIDGKASEVIEFAFETVTLVKAGVNWNVI